jgi:hypothetical protein
MLCSIEEEGGCKIGAYTSRAGLNLGVVKMRVEQGKKVIRDKIFSTSFSRSPLDNLCGNLIVIGITSPILT